MALHWKARALQEVEKSLRRVKTHWDHTSSTFNGRRDDAWLQGSFKDRGTVSC